MHNDQPPAASEPPVRAAFTIRIAAGEVTISYVAALLTSRGTRCWDRTNSRYPNWAPATVTDGGLLDALAWSIAQGHTITVENAPET